MKNLLEYPNVIGHGTGFKYVGGKKIDQICMTVFVTKKLPKIALHIDDIIPTKRGSYPTDVVEIGIVRALQSRTDTWRPAPPGVSIGHFAITAGTFGCVVRKNNERFILSNNHVLANQNNASIGDRIYQPGKYDGGFEAIALLEDFVPIKFEDGSGCFLARGVANVGNWAAKLVGSSHRLKVYQEVQAVENLVDAAIARPINDAVIIDEILEIGWMTGKAEVDLGTPVKKSGRTTGLTFGTIITINATIKVQYGDGVVTFKDQLVTTNMSQPGDSGSLLVNEDHKAVGLLFAGSDQVTIHNRIFNVLDLLGVTV